MLARPRSTTSSACRRLRRRSRRRAPSTRRSSARRAAARPTGVSSAAWMRDLPTAPPPATTPARASRPRARSSSRSCSAFSRATMPTRCARPSWSLERSLVLNSSNRAANELLPRAGGAAAVDTRREALGATASLPAAATCSSPASARRPGGCCASPLPPTTVADQPTFPCCKYTTAHDLGTLLVSLTLAATGHGPALRHGISAREARVALWLLLHASYPGLVRPVGPFPVGHKAGWLPRHPARRGARVHAPRHARRGLHELLGPGRQLCPRARRRRRRRARSRYALTRLGRRRARPRARRCRRSARDWPAACGPRCARAGARARTA